MESLTQEQDKLVQMGTINPTKYQSMYLGDSNQSKGNKKPKYLKQQEKKKSKEKPKSSDGGSNPNKEKGKKQESSKCTYCHKGWNPEIACMKKTIDMMA